MASGYSARRDLIHPEKLDMEGVRIESTVVLYHLNHINSTCCTRYGVLFLNSSIDMPSTESRRVNRVRRYY